MNLLTTYTHDSELQTITAPPLISTIHKSPQHPLSLFQPAVFTSRSLATASNSGDLSGSRAQVLFSQTLGTLLVSCLAYSSTLKMEVIHTSETDDGGRAI
jgi:hypothetical protein